jgi:hypothetical protein
MCISFEIEMQRRCAARQTKISLAGSECARELFMHILTHFQSALDAHLAASEQAGVEVALFALFIRATRLLFE